MTRLSLRDAIDAFCKDCIYDPGNGNGGWREQVEACCSSNCPLHAVRPRSAVKAAKSGADARAQADAPEVAEPSVSELLGSAFRPDAPISGHRADGS